MESQVLDSMDLEKERGITIKAQTATLNYKAKDGQTYLLNLIDTPGHVDFSYEVSRSLSACEGALLVVDATQGVAKTGMGIDEILERVVERIPAPQGDPAAPLQALIIDSWFDNYVGVVMLVRVVNGTIKPKDKIRLMATGANHLVEQVGVFTPKSQTSLMLPNRPKKHSPVLKKQRARCLRVFIRLNPTSTMHFVMH